MTTLEGEDPSVDAPLLLALSPLLAVSDLLVKGLALGILTMLVMGASLAVMTLLRRALTPVLHLPAALTITATFTACAELAMHAAFPEMADRLGLFLPLIAVNGLLIWMLVLRPEGAARRAVWKRGATFAGVLLSLSAVREWFGCGTLFDEAELLFGPAGAALELRWAADGAVLLRTPFGAFMALGLLLAGYQAWRARQSGAPR